ncbi:HAD family hydrolase, partial [Priestia megaterium]
MQSVTQVRPEAVDFVDWAFAQGYTIAIATNPLFPRTAIEQRLAWAKLPVDKYPFKIVSSYEGFHFAKPNPAFL